MLVNSTYHVSQTVNNCEGHKAPVQVTLTKPAAPSASAQSFCSSSNATVANLQPSGNNYKWYADNGTLLQSSTPLVNGTYHVSQTVNNCEGDKKVVQVTLIKSAAPSASAQSFCSSSNATVAYLQ